MVKLSAQLSVALAMLTALVLVCFKFFAAPVLSETPDVHVPNQPTLVATAPTPPSLVRAVLGGKPVYVLYVTRTEDTVLIRCYPGYEPSITVRALGPNPKANMQKEGIMTCRPSA